ncbi:MAG: hypothetical protein HC804_09290, partial [Anaerolineae bacterium]|nr:hypothetical protein [Anaerolineae bacterium]
NSAGNTVQISNTIVASNTTSSGFSGINRTGGTVTGDYVNLFNNTSSETFNTTIVGNPAFINLSIFNLHLAQGSPNINAGNSTIPQDIDQQARPNGPAVDIGADEFYANIPAFSWTPLFTEEFVDRGSSPSYDHLLVNENSTEADTYTFTCSNDRGWTVTCPLSQTLPVGQFTVVSTQINVPGSATRVTSSEQRSLPPPQWSPRRCNMRWSCVTLSAQSLRFSLRPATPSPIRPAKSSPLRTPSPTAAMRRTRCGCRLWATPLAGRN